MHSFLDESRFVAYCKCKFTITPKQINPSAVGVVCSWPLGECLRSKYWQLYRRLLHKMNKVMNASSVHPIKRFCDEFFHTRSRGTNFETVHYNWIMIASLPASCNGMTVYLQLGFIINSVSQTTVSRNPYHCFVRFQHGVSGQKLSNVPRYDTVFCPTLIITLQRWSSSETACYVLPKLPAFSNFLVNHLRRCSCM